VTEDEEKEALARELARESLIVGTIVSKQHVKITTYLEGGTHKIEGYLSFRTEADAAECARVLTEAKKPAEAKKPGSGDPRKPVRPADPLVVSAKSSGRDVRVISYVDGDCETGGRFLFRSWQEAAEFACVLAEARRPAA